MGALSTILIVAYLLIVLALIAVILLQRSEGGGLGMGTSSNNGLVSVRGSANLLTRTTGILAALFFATAIGLTILSELDRGTDSILNNVTQNGEQPTVLDALQQLQQQSAGDLPVPATDGTTPAATTPATDTSLPVPAATDPAPATDAAPAATDAAPAAESPAAPADSTAPAAETPAAPATEQPAAPAN